MRSPAAAASGSKTAGRCGEEGGVMLPVATAAAAALPTACRCCGVLSWRRHHRTGVARSYVTSAPHPPIPALVGGGTAAGVNLWRPLRRCQCAVGGAGATGGGCLQHCHHQSRQSRLPLLLSLLARHPATRLGGHQVVPVRVAHTGAALCVGSSTVALRAVGEPPRAVCGRRSCPPLPSPCQCWRR